MSLTVSRILALFMLLLDSINFFFFLVVWQTAWICLECFTSLLITYMAMLHVCIETPIFFCRSAIWSVKNYFSGLSNQRFIKSDIAFLDKDIRLVDSWYGLHQIQRTSSDLSCSLFLRPKLISAHTWLISPFNAR